MPLAFSYPYLCPPYAVVDPARNLLDLHVEHWRGLLGFGVLLYEERDPGGRVDEVEVDLSGLLEVGPLGVVAELSVFWVAPSEDQAITVDQRAELGPAGNTRSGSAGVSDL